MAAELGLSPGLGLLGFDLQAKLHPSYQQHAVLNPLQQRASLITKSTSKRNYLQLKL